MLVVSFVITSIILSVGYASEENNDVVSNNNSEYSLKLNEASSCEVKMSNIYSKLDLLRKKNNDLEDIVHEKFHKLEKNILDKLEDYIEGKLDSVEKNSNRKIDSLETNTNRNMDSLEKNMKNAIDKMENNVQRRIEAMERNVADKTDIFIMYRKFDSLKKLYSGADVNLISESQTSPNKTLLNTEETKQYLTIPDFDLNIKHDLDVLVKNNSELLDKNLNSTLTVLENNKLNKFKFSIRNDILDSDIRNVTLGETNSQKKNVLWNRPQNSCVCKKRVIHSYDYEPMRLDNDTFNHVTAEINGDGIIRFEMRLAIKSSNLAIIQLSTIPNPGAVGNEYYLIGVGDNSQSQTFLYTATQKNDKSNEFAFTTGLQTMSTPGIVSLNNVTSFYVKIEQQTLEFGKTGNLPPILRYKDAAFDRVKYIGFTSYGSADSYFLYDCPPGFEDMLNL